MIVGQPDVEGEFYGDHRRLKRLDRWIAGRSGYFRRRKSKGWRRHCRHVPADRIPANWLGIKMGADA